MSKHLFGTIGALSEAACDHVFHRDVFRHAPTVTIDFAPTGEPICRAPTEQEREFVGVAVIEGVKLLSQEKLPKRERAMDRFLCESKRRAEEALTVGGVCGFGIVLTALISWLIGQALNWIWRWYINTDEAPALICGMVGVGS